MHSIGNDILRMLGECARESWLVLGNCSEQKLEKGLLVNGWKMLYLITFVFLVRHVVDDGDHDDDDDDSTYKM